MNRGSSARFGFRFSDLLIIERVLQHLIQKRRAEVATSFEEPEELRATRSR